MFVKSAALFSLAAMVHGRAIMSSNDTAPVPTPTMIPTPIFDPPTATPTAGPGPVGAMTGPCTEEGLWNCVDGSAFQRCASGAWSVLIPMAAGTHCMPGQTTNFEIMPGGAMDPVPTPVPTPGAGAGTGPECGPTDTMSGPCKNEGLWNCIDGVSYQRCASGVWSVVQPVAAGTKCEKGKSMDFKSLHKRSFAHGGRRVVV